MPALALGGEKSYGVGRATELEFVAGDVKGGILPNSDRRIAGQGSHRSHEKTV